MTHKTKAIILKTIKYGETSLVVTAFTELFGVQTYMVNGVRSSKQASAKANYFQPSSILEMVVYHHEQKTMQRIKEFKFAYLYQNIFSDVIKNSIALFCVELLNKCLKQPETNADLYNFCEDALHQLDNCNKKATANFPLFFALHLPHFFGFRMIDNHNEENSFFDLQEGVFCEEQPHHPSFIEGQNAFITSQLLKTMLPTELEQLQLNKDVRRYLLHQYQNYYSYHVQDFGQLKTLMVLGEVL
ncbi:MAG: DNA repair protein RecO [Ferruginibacter sp.]|nr:DNA repair protein RecO [Ferruginibacter sp.]